MRLCKGSKAENKSSINCKHKEVELSRKSVGSDTTKRVLLSSKPNIKLETRNFQMNFVIVTARLYQSGTICVEIKFGPLSVGGESPHRTSCLSAPVSCIPLNKSHPCWGKAWDTACSVADTFWCSHRETQQRNITD